MPAGTARQPNRVPVAFEPLESRTLMSAAPPVALSPGTAASPGPVIVNLDPTFKWSAVSGVSVYQIHIYDKTDGQFISANVGQSATSYTPAHGALKPGDQFVWNVRDLVTTSTTDTYSNYLNFSLHSMPAPSVIGPGSSTSPGPVLTTLTPTLTWHAVTAVTGFTGYQINLYDITTGHFITHTVGASVTQYTIPTALTAGDKYVWNVRILVGTRSGPPSTYLYFVA